jgi:hypothetical protein
VRNIGPAALPFLTRWIHYDPPQWRHTLVYWLFRTPLPFAQKLSERVTDPTLANGTPIAFAVLGTQAMPAFDDLCRFMNDAKRPGAAMRAAMVLPVFGSNALAPLLAVVTNSSHPAQITALRTVLAIADSGNAQQVVPAVANCLVATNTGAVKMLAITILGKLYTAPETSIPALVSCLKSANPEVRVYSADTLGAFGSRASTAIPALTNALGDPDPLVRKQAAWALTKIAPAAFTNAP